MKKFFITVGIIICAFGIWYYVALSPVDVGSEEGTTITVTPGSSTEDIGSLLKESGMIRSVSAFKMYVRLQQADGKLQAGKFVVRKSQSVAEIVEMLRSGKAEELIITIPEGFTVKDIDSLLATKGLIEQGEVIDCANNCDFSSFEFLPDAEGLAPRGGKLEGYLFPDTYYVETSGFVPKFFLERLLTKFRHAVVEDLADEFDGSSRSLAENITVASLIEEESRNDDERRIVSDILWKRVDDGWGLGVDATVRYVTDNVQEEITHADLNVNSPYNTRKFKGLPPGPIANPGLASIRAALDPKQSPYWYYLHDTEGQIHYAVTNEEHNTNRMRYLGS